MSSEPVVIVSGARTPMGGLQGALAGVSAIELGSAAIAETVRRAGLDAALIEEVIMGCVLPAGLRQGPARQAALNAGIPASTGCVTLNKLCGSGMQAAIYGHDQIRAGSCDIVLAGGMESMTNAPHLLPNARSGVRSGHVELKDHLFFDGLEDAFTGRPMGSFAQETAAARGISREAMDAFAIESLQRAQQAIEHGWLQAEMAPVTVRTRNGEIVVTDDEQPLKARLDKIPQLKPAFAKDGTITAANASSISDGASALLLMRAGRAADLRLTPMARIVGHARHSQAPGEFTLAPVGAIRKLFQRTGWRNTDVDLFEINEAFAMVTMIAMQDLDLDPQRVNIHGGACAQGHPIGSTGSRLIVSLLHALKRTGQKKGVASLCIGGGEATAIAIEML